MAGIKRFNPDEALDRAMTAFWRRGYAAKLSRACSQDHKEIIKTVSSAQERD